MKLTLEEKLKCVKMHIFEDKPIYEISKEYGLDPARLKYAVQLYNKWGEKAFSKDQERKPYTRELKLQTIHEIETTGVSYRQKAVDLMLTDPTIIRDWMKLYRKYGESAIKDTYSREAYKHHDDKILEKNYQKLIEDLERTKAENEYLKKSYSLILKRSKPLKKKS